MKSFKELNAKAQRRKGRSHGISVAFPFLPQRSQRTQRRGVNFGIKFIPLLCVLCELCGKKLSPLKYFETTPVFAFNSLRIFPLVHPLSFSLYPLRFYG